MTRIHGEPQALGLQDTGQQILGQTGIQEQTAKTQNPGGVRRSVGVCGACSLEPTEPEDCRRPVSFDFLTKMSPKSEKS